MNDLKELADYVVEHPEAYEYRWRLAKKLYMAWEYNEALRHLLILKKDWTRKLNVLRYLAATLYRLGRYQEAVDELEGILGQWPLELPVWEQLAKVREVMGDYEKAAKAWEEVIRLDPDHSIAGRAIERLRIGPADTPRDKLHLGDSDSGINLSTGKVCGNCGAQNSEEFDRCWQCHALLNQRQTPADFRPKETAPSSTMLWLRPLLGGIAAVASLSAAIYIALVHLPSEEASAVVPASVYDALARTLYMPRAAIGTALALGSPLILLGVFRVARIRGLNLVDALGAGILVASCTYLLLWTPIEYQPYAVAGPAAASAFVMALFLPDGRFARVAVAWLIHSILATALGIAVWIVLVGIEPMRDWPVIARYAELSQSASRETHVPAGETPYACTLLWSTSGSAWLDKQCNVVSFNLETARVDMPMTVELAADGAVQHATSQAPYRFVHQITPDTRYTLRIAAPEDGSFTGTITSFLPLAIGL